MKKILALSLAGVMCFSLAACGSSDETVGEEIEDVAEEAVDDVKEAAEDVAEDVKEGAEDIAEGVEEVAEDVAEDAKDVAFVIEDDIMEAVDKMEGVTFTIGTCQSMEHVALDAATQGFEDVISKALGDAVTFDEQNAQGDTATCATIINSFVSNNVDLILANATPSLQAAAAGTDTIPILGTSITDYGAALDIDFTGTVGGNISGTSDLAPLDGQAEMLQELFPDAETVGLLFCSAEANSKFQVDTVQEYLEDMGYTCTQYSFADSNDLASVTTVASSESDVIYIPTDNTAAENTELIQNICLPDGTPVIAGEEGICSGCGVATLSISYYDLGVATGKMALRILLGLSDISEMPVEYAPDVTKEYNASNCEELGVEIPKDYVAIEE